MITDFDRDDGNWPKCGKHGLTKEEIEAVFRSGPHVFGDPSIEEQRKRAIGVTSTGRHAFVVFTLRQRHDKVYIRPISARFMHQEEIEFYESQIGTEKNS